MSNYPNNNCPRPIVVPSSAYSQPAPCSTPITLGGDVIGYNYDNTVTKVQNIKWTPTLPTVGQIPIYTATGDIQWTTPTSFSTLTVVNGSGLVLTGTQLDINCTSLVSHCDLVTNTVADLKYLKLSGGIVTGNLTVNGVTEVADLSSTGTVSFDALAGVGTRMVTVNSTGILSVTSLPSSTTISMSNLGTGKRVLKNYDSLTGVAEFGTLVAGNGMELVETPTGIIVNSTVTPEILTFTNLGATGVGVFKQKTPSGVVELFRISAGQNVVLNQNATSIEVSVPNIGETNDLAFPGAAVPNSASIRIDKTSNIIAARRLRGVQNMTITENGNYIDFSATDSQTLTLSGNNLSISGGNSIILPSTSVSVADSSTLDFTLTGTTITATAPIRYNGTNATQPAGSTPLGYNFTSSGTIAITNPTAGVINLEATGIQGFFTKDINPAGNVNATVGTNTSVIAFTGTWTANRIVTLQSAGAVLGSRIEISTVNAELASTYTLQVVDQVSGLPLTTSTLETKYTFIFDGANWIQFA